MAETEVFLEGLSFGEAPRWHERRLWFSDFYQHAIFSVGERADLRTEAELADEPSGLGWLPDGSLLCVSMTERLVLRREPDGTFVTHADLRPLATFHGNDMVVAKSGVAYVANFGFDLEAFYEGKAAPSTTALIRVDPDGSVHEAAAEMAFPNGMVLFDDGRTLVVAESFAGHLSAFDVTEDGSLSGRRVWAGPPNLAPDGICLDAAGGIWVANAAANEVWRLTEGGTVTDVVTTSQLAVACMLGGEDRRTLYVCTAPTTARKDVEHKRGARLETVRAQIPGAGLP